MDRWIPLTQYAMEEGVSISTLRRKIKANSIEYKLDNGRYLIKSDDATAPAAASASAPAESSEVFRKSSNDQRSLAPTDSTGTPAMYVGGKDHGAEIAKISKDVRQSLADMDLRWRALEARVNGLAKKVDFLIEQNSELSMLVKVFEEKLDATI